MNMWEDEMNDAIALKTLFAGETIIRPISRLNGPNIKSVSDVNKAAPAIVSPETALMKPKPTEAALDLKNEARKPSYPKYSFILSQKIEAYSEDARLMLENIVTKALVLSMNQVEMLIWEKPVITVFDLNVKGPGCYFIFGVNCLGQKGLMEKNEVFKSAGQLIITAEDPELLRVNTQQRTWLWSVMKTNAF